MRLNKKVTFIKIPLVAASFFVLIVAFQNCAPEVKFASQNGISSGSGNEAGPVSGEIPKEPDSIDSPDQFIFQIQVGSGPFAETIVTQDFVFEGGFEGFIILN